MGSIAGQGVGMPTGIGEVDSAWMTAVLRTSGAIDETTSVLELDSAPFAVGAGLLSLLYRTSLTYTGGSGPATVIVKFPTDDPMQRGVCDALGFYARELEFYRSFAADAPFGTAQCHAAVEGDAGTDFVVVMEDLSHLDAVDQRDGCSWEQSLESVRMMARFHARWQATPELAGLAELFLPIKNDMYTVALPELFATGWSQAKIHGTKHLTPDLVALGDRWGTLIGFFQDNLMEPSTVLHGDWRADNLLFDGDELYVLDFQIMSVGAGIYDLGYFASQSIPSEVRAGRDAELVQLYVDTLASCGVSMDFDDAMLQYRVSLANHLIYAVTSFQTYEQLPERSKELMQTMLQRAGQAILDNDVLAVLPD